MGHFNSKGSLPLKSITCATSGATNSKNIIGDSIFDTNVSIKKVDDFYLFLDLIIDPVNIAIYKENVSFFILTKADKPDKDYIKPFIDIICRCSINCSYGKYAIDNADAIFCLGLNETMVNRCKYISFCTYKIVNQYCVADRSSKPTSVGKINLICSFQPFSESWFGKRKSKNLTDSINDNNLLKQSIQKDLNVGIGAFIAYKCLQYMILKEKLNIVVLEATDSKNVSIYQKWGFRLGLGPLFDYSESLNKKLKKGMNIDKALKQIQKEHEKSLSVSATSTLLNMLLPSKEKEKNKEQIKENCELLYNESTGYKMYMECKEENLLPLKNYILSKSSQLDLFDIHTDSFDFSKYQKDLYIKDLTI